MESLRRGEGGAEEIEMVDMKELAISLDEAYGFSKPTSSKKDSRKFRFSTKLPPSNTKDESGDKATRGRRWYSASARGQRSQLENLNSPGIEESCINSPGAASVDTPNSIKTEASEAIEVTHASMSAFNGSGKGQHFQKRREKSARILITIVLTFLFCHTFRFVIKAYEVTHPSHSTYEHHVYCLHHQKLHIPVILHVMLSLSHFLLVVNSSVNFIIYCCVGKRFRKELKEIVYSLCRSLRSLVCFCRHRGEIQQHVETLHVVTVDE